MKNAAYLKAMAKKAKYLTNKNIESGSSDDSDEDLSSDDEYEVSKNMLFKWFNNRYICIKYLGRGTFSRVWLVYDIAINQYFAMKIIFSKYNEDAQHEIKINTIIDNKNNNDSKLLRCFDYFTENNSIHFIYELMGFTLLDVLKKYDDEHILDLYIIKKIIIQIFESLSELHSKNLIHTDIKPENIMFTQKPMPIKNLIEYYSNLNIKNKYEKLLLENNPNNLDTMNKSRRKNQKRKIKLKVQRLLSDYLKIHQYSDNDITFPLNIKDIDITDISNKKDELIDIDNKDHFNLDIESMNIKIIDYGNSEQLGDLIQDEIMIRNYRPPENIMNEFYNQKADVWAVGCIIFEIFTGQYLFELDSYIKPENRDKDHLHQMYEVLGKIPREMALNCDFTDDLFDNKGRILKMKHCDYTSISAILNEEFDYNKTLSNEIELFLKKLFDYDLKKRYSADDVLTDKWLKI